MRSIDGTAGNCYSPISRRILLYPVPESHFFELILLDSFALYDWSTIPDISVWCESHVRNNSNQGSKLTLVPSPEATGNSGG